MFSILSYDDDKVEFSIFLQDTGVTNGRKLNGWQLFLHKNHVSIK